MSLPKTMKALVARSATDYELVYDYPVPECGPDDIIIKTEACGICAGDLKCQHGAGKFWGDDTQASWVEAPLFPDMNSSAELLPWENVEGYELGDV